MNRPTIHLKVTTEEETVGIKAQGVQEVPIDDYRKLKNKPSINGTELNGNYDEIDPTVPDWAKRDKKPTYTAEEIGAVEAGNEMSYADIQEIWNSIFGGN